MSQIIRLAFILLLMFILFELVLCSLTKMVKILQINFMISKIVYKIGFCIKYFIIYCIK